MKRSINFRFTSLFILLYTTEEFTLIFLDNFGTEIAASSLNSDKIWRSKSSIFAMTFSKDRSEISN